MHLAAGAAALPAVSRIAKAQNFPTRADGKILTDAVAMNNVADLLTG
jgi:hypothetical protein